MKFYEWTKHKLKHERETKKEPTYKEIEAVVVPKLIEIWVRSSIPTLEPKRVKVMLQTYHLKCKNLLKSHPKIPENKLKKFRLGSKVLFDIAACKCRDLLQCACPKNKKIPSKEHNVITDQRTARQMMIGGIDVRTTKQITRSLKRKLLREKSASKQPKVTKVCTEKLSSSSGSECTQSDCEKPIRIQSRAPSIKSESTSIKTAVDYALLSKTCDRFGVSDRAGAAIASVVLHASTSQVIDKNKLRRERKKTRDIITSQQNVSLIPALYFDGRKDQTVTISEKDGKRHMFEHIDGTTSGPRTFSRSIGKELENCEKRPIVHFQPIPTDLRELSAEDISTDQKYLYKIVEAVSIGTFSNDLANKSPGKMSHARWLTRANRILRLYASVETPSENLITLATYIVRVYAPVWFAIKTHSSCKDGPRHLFKLIELTRYLPTTLKNIFDPIIQRNAYFAHPENLLLVMLTDFQPHIRELAARRILKARSAKPKRLRLFQLPEVTEHPDGAATRESKTLEHSAPSRPGERQTAAPPLARPRYDASTGTNISPEQIHFDKIAL
ncbi:hypothetical protein EVAR_14303_1 [Eumeta japonica]|uniref:Uncharacterized protein n=1 Tax=Eumeta variegata TaxID=151549 RepID=A0A4C1UNC3_EUMVA|nr:hypothetical protein EVAR_14303_1 [Eumeta japonica]